jgi:hypothetical protein
MVYSNVTIRVHAPPNVPVIKEGEPEPDPPPRGIR